MDVFRESERGSVKGAGGVEYGVAVEVAPVSDGYAHLGLGLQLAVEEHDGFG